MWIKEFLDFVRTSTISKWFDKYGFLLKDSGDTTDGFAHDGKFDADSISIIQHRITQIIK